MEQLLSEAGGLSIILTDTANPASRHFIHQQIVAFNNANSPRHQTIRQAGPRPLDIFIRDAQGELVGGLVASTYWGWLDIDDLWVAESLRGQGYGRQLLLAAESEAKRRDCTRVFLQTFSFQAREFYEKMGYRAVGELIDYPPGHAYFWMRKDLQAEPDAP